MPLYIDESRRNWLTKMERASREEINVGCLQRIALALETMAQSWSSLERDRDWYRSRLAKEEVKSEHLQNQIRGLKGALTKRKKGG